MCGIVGYTGPGNALISILEGLTRLEYRGYDSAGVCLEQQGELKVLKKEGKLENLKNLLAQSDYFSHRGIGHTRWATHGGVTTDNAHPHANDLISVVHNGIIENATTLKQELLQEGWQFKSQTDSEVFLVLLTKLYSKHHSIIQAIADSFKLIRGNSAFVIMLKGQESLYAIRRSAPLVCGLNPSSQEAFISSDPFALVGFASEIFFPEDGVICQASPASSGAGNQHQARIQFFDLEGNLSTKFKMQPNKASMDATSKGGFDHYMMKEIHEQPGLIEKLAAYYLKGEGKQKLLELNDFLPERIHIIACGTAWHAGFVCKTFFEKYNQIPTAVEIASEFRYKNPLLKKNDLALFISQSGETADTLACQELCQKAGLKTYSIVNVENSSLYRQSDKNFLIHAGVEIGVASTKAFTQQVLTGYLMSLFWSQKINEVTLYQKFKRLADKTQELLHKEAEIAMLAQALFQKKGFIFTGRGPLFPIALEGALKLKEIAYVHAEGYAAGELKHGPIALIDNQMVNIALLSDELYEKTLSNLQEVKARSGIVFAIGPKNETEWKDLADFKFDLDLSELNDLNPILINVVLQFFSYFVAKHKGTDIDKPRNLAKSVTVE
jgi:glucosamine--fructose-6-phosphate aminotransferase (isomerizing)